jgi:hypothetical protein
MIQAEVRSISIAQRTTRPRRWISGIVAAALLAATGPMAMAGTMQQATLTATVDGAPWKADFGLAVTTPVAGKPVLTISGTSNAGGATSTFIASFPVPATGSFIGTFPIHAGIMGKVPTASFNMPQRSTDIMEQHFTMAEGAIVVESFDTAQKTISGHFSAKGQTLSGSTPIVITDGAFANVPVTPDPAAQ